MPALFRGVVDYASALEEMESLQKQRREGAIGDTIYYLEHPPVITYGRATPDGDRNLTGHSIPEFAISRGGLATYHGPGQLVGYFIVDLNHRSGGRGGDAHEFLRAVEEGLIQYLASEYQIAATRREGFTGVWIKDSNPARKIASIGISIRRWVTAHGFALNVSTDLSAYDLIVPCGIADCVMTSVSRERGGAVDGNMREVAAGLHVHLAAALRSYGWCLEL